MDELRIQASVYARKSTDQNGVAEEARSVNRQIARAREYCEKRGWSLSPEHIYTDDGISGAEYSRRPGFVRLMTSLSPKPQFQRLVMMETSRLGRESIETSYALKQIIQAGVRVYTYLDDQEKILDTAMDKVVMSLATYSDECEREKARIRVYDAAKKRAEEGKVTGGVTFGYDNEVVSLPLGADGSVHRSHVQRVVNKEQAKVIVQIYELYASGLGLTRIAKLLNAERAPSPSSRRGHKASWAKSTIRTILDRSDYTGVVIWNRTQKRDKWGQINKTNKPESEWITKKDEDLRIVPAELAKKVERQKKAMRSRMLRQENGKLLGRPRATGTKYLLAGLMRCTCGMAMEARKRSQGHFYACSAYHRKGKSVCSNGLSIKGSILENAVLSQLSDALLDASIIHDAIDEAIARIEGDDGKAKQIELIHQIKELKQQIGRFVEAIAQGVDAKSLGSELKNREAKLEEVELELEALRIDQSTAWRKDPNVRKALESRIQDWKNLLKRHAPQTSQILKKLIAGRLTLTPHTDGAVPFYSFEGVGTVTGLLAGVVPQDVKKVQPS